MILVLERKTTARLGEDLDVASSGASLGSRRHGCGESTAEWLRDTECQFLSIDEKCYESLRR